MFHFPQAENSTCALASPLPTKAVRLCGAPFFPGVAIRSPCRPQGGAKLRFARIYGFPFAVPGGCPRSFDLRPPPTAAPAAPLLYLPPAAQRLATTVAPLPRNDTEIYRLCQIPAFGISAFPTRCRKKASRGETTGGLVYYSLAQNSRMRRMASMISSVFAV